MKLIKILGDEKEASKIAKNIVQQRNIKKIYNTIDLNERLLKKVKKEFLQ